MKMKFFYFENDLEISGERISVLEIEDKKLYNKFTSIIYNKINNDIKEEDEEIYLFDNSEEVGFHSTALYISDPMQIDFEDKVIMGAVGKEIKKYFNLNMEEQSECEKQNLKLFTSFQKSLVEFSLDFNYSTVWDISKYLKMIGLKIEDKFYRTHLEKLYAIIDIVSELKLYKFIVFCNLKSYFEIEEIQKIYKYVMYKKIPIVLLESTISNISIEDENKIIIDKEFDELKRYDII